MNTEDELAPVNDSNLNALLHFPLSDVTLNMDMDMDIQSTIDPESDYFTNIIERGVLSNYLLQHQSMDDILNSSFDDHSGTKYKNVLSDEGKQSLKVERYQPDICKNDHCPITQDKFEINQYITVLPCFHGFITSSINKWLEDQCAVCPVCRLELKSREVKNEEYRESGSIHRSRESLLYSLQLIESITNPLGSRNMVHPFGPSQLVGDDASIPHSYISSTIDNEY